MSQSKNMRHTAAQVKCHVWVSLIIEVAGTEVQLSLRTFYDVDDGLRPLKMGREIILIFGPDMLQIGRCQVTR